MQKENLKNIPSNPLCRGKSTGFTLVEVMVVTVAATLLMLGITSATMTSIASSTKAEHLSILEQEGQFIMNQIKEVLQNSGGDAVRCTDYQYQTSTGNTTGSMRSPLEVTSSKDGGVTRFTCRQSGTTYYIASDSASQGTGNVTIKLQGNETFLVGGANSSGCRGFTVNCVQNNTIYTNREVDVGITLGIGTVGGSPAAFTQKSFSQKFTVRD